MSNDERRRLQRLPIPGAVQGEVRIVHPLRLLEISEGGVSLEVTQPLTLESLHDFRIEFGTSTVVVKGRVAHCRVAQIEHGQVAYRAGIEFVDLAPHVREAIDDYIIGLKRKV